MNLLKRGKNIDYNYWKENKFYNRFLVKASTLMDEEFYPLWMHKIEDRIFMQVDTDCIGDDISVFYYVELDSKTYNDFKLKKINLYQILKKEEYILKTIVNYEYIKDKDKIKTDYTFEIISHSKILDRLKVLGILESYNNSENYPFFDDKFYYE